ncbi:hypothetical protein BH23GEM9_BH23GEM9_15260 [soil metagenome]
MKTRAGFTLVEVMIALSLTAIIGAAVTGVFVTQSGYFDHQEKMSFARGVSRGATNIMVSELRMLERSNGLVSASNRHITVLAPYAMGVSCGPSGGKLIVSQVPADTMMTGAAGFSGYAYRTGAGAYVYVSSTTAPTSGAGSVCTNVRVRSLPADSGGRVVALSPSSAAAPGAPVLLYQRLTYEFKNSVQVPGRIALWRRIEDLDSPRDEELVAPFDTSAGFRFFVNDAPTPVSTVPGTLSTVSGVQLILDGLNERPAADGSLTRVPMKTSVFFKNR